LSNVNAKSPAMRPWLLDSGKVARRVNGETIALGLSSRLEKKRYDWREPAAKGKRTGSGVGRINIMEELRKRNTPGNEAKGCTMLVLSRKKNESIVINNDITIVVVEIRGDKFRLGVEAPKEVPVHRREVYDAIRRHDLSTEDKAGSEAGAPDA
jgi:carbon storage regulator